ncbi:hypothetical protein ACWN8V_10280 [Vagococcus elongatus]|uniref:DNA-directed RNA polymerase beta subunit n=1 Tax=Vagococcus elongatus TaxID=180344 RepID=A0A430APX8_9ENTE|nr:hypothetical protein [Vagococcus elongatus]RSU10149.1 hypothetical protein CBF29_10195 [Vagococcus elongatus]
MKLEYQHILRHYQDRKKMKWMGFYLSDHTAQIDKDRIEQQPVSIKKERLSESEINKILAQAKIKGLTVSIQKEEINLENSYLSDIEGKISGSDESNIFINDQKVGYDQIKHVEIIDHKKWSSL